VQDVEHLCVQDPGLPGWAMNHIAMTGVKAEDAMMWADLNVVVSLTVLEVFRY
jgi:hypothetical protein